MTAIPLLPATCPRPEPLPAQYFGEGQQVRIPQGQRVVNIQAVTLRLSGWWYAVELAPGCRKWYSQDQLLTVRPLPGDLVRYEGRVGIALDYDLVFDLTTGEYIETTSLLLALDGTVLVRGFWTPGPAEQAMLNRRHKIDALADYWPALKLQTVETTNRRGETVYEVRMSA